MFMVSLKNYEIMEKIRKAQQECKIILESITWTKVILMVNNKWWKQY
jgi:lipopolysaccharide biosynthesis glycosyltransferase